ncbi:MAG: MBL fold metallo-hydrolase [bacterium]|nr:MBL fold metallo-hydrolase [bacterium]
MSGKWHFENETVRIRKTEVGGFGNNSYVVACRRTGESVIVDAADDAEAIIAAAADTSPMAVITTHGHADHVGAALSVAAGLTIPLHLHPADWDICPVAVDMPLEPGELRIGEATVSLVHTPGHTPGSMGIVTEGAAITGDTLFPGGPGATRFPYSDFDQIIESLEREYFSLPDETIVMPGHGLDTTIGTERPALPEWRERRW